MIYVIMCGRLGNQLFQYATAKRIQKLTGQKIAIDFTAINQVGNAQWRNYLSEYKIDDFEIVDNKSYYPIQRFIYKILKMLRPKNSEKRQLFFDEKICKPFFKYGVIYYESTYKATNIEKIKAKNIVVRGWFESEKYFDCISQELNDEYVPKTVSKEHEDLINKLKEANAICVTIRRGNFTEDKYKDKYLVCTPTYYYSAVEYIKKIHPNSIVYVCSDDIEWCKSSLKFSGEVFFEPTDDIVTKLYLMSLCKHFVISNSTYSWWAQYLSQNNNKIVVAPNVWRNCELPPEDIFSDDWVRMDSKGRVKKDK